MLSQVVFDAIPYSTLHLVFVIATVPVLLTVVELIAVDVDVVFVVALIIFVATLVVDVVINETAAIFHVLVAFSEFLVAVFVIKTVAIIYIIAVTHVFVVLVENQVIPIDTAAVGDILVLVCFARVGVFYLL